MMKRRINMIKIENTDVYGFETALRATIDQVGVSNAVSDSYFDSESYETEPKDGCIMHHEKTKYYIGSHDFTLMTQCIRKGSGYDTFLTMIHAAFDITAPLYWFLEFFGYDVLYTTRGIPFDKEISPDIFSFENVKLCEVGKAYLEELEKIRTKFNGTRKAKYWNALIQLVPCGLNMKILANLTYHELRKMYKGFHGDHSGEWKEFCKWIETLPYSELITA